MPVLIPTKAELMTMRQTMSNIEIAAEKRVSTSTVKRWVRKLGVPPRESKQPVEDIKPKGVPMPIVADGAMQTGSGAPYG